MQTCFIVLLPVKIENQPNESQDRNLISCTYFPIKELQGREFFCRRYQTLRLLRNVPPFVGTENSLFCSHRLTNGLPLQRTHPSLKLCVTFNIIPSAYGKREISLCPTPMQENNPLLTVHNCLFITFTVNLQTWSPFPTHTNQRHAIP
jgi:hypothetical protein